MVIKKTGAVFALVLALFGLCPAQTENDRPLTLAECVDLALKQNPLVLSSFEQYNASLARVRQAGAFPQPALSFDRDLQSSPFNLKGSRESYIGVEQSFEFPGKRLLRRHIASLESEETLSDLDLLKQDIAYQVREAFFSLLLAEKKNRERSTGTRTGRGFSRQSGNQAEGRRHRRCRGPESPSRKIQSRQCRSGRPERSPARHGQAEFSAGAEEIRPTRNPGKSQKEHSSSRCRGSQGKGFPRPSRDEEDPCRAGSRQGGQEAGDHGIFSRLQPGPQPAQNRRREVDLGLHGLLSDPPLFLAAPEGRHGGGGSLFPLPPSGRSAFEKLHRSGSGGKPA